MMTPGQTLAAIRDKIEAAFREENPVDRNMHLVQAHTFALLGAHHAQQAEAAAALDAAVMAQPETMQ